MGEKQLNRADLARELAYRIAGRRMAILDHPEAEALGILDLDTGELIHEGDPGEELNTRFAAYLLEGACPENLYAGELDAGEEGTFAGSGSQWHGSLRLDPFWGEAMRRRTRARARARLKDASGEYFKTAWGQKEAQAMTRKVQGKPISWRLGWKFVTLTFPHGEGDWSGMSSVEQIAFINGAFRRLTRSAWWGTWNGGKLARVILGVKGVEDDLTWKGPHVHVHLLLLARYLDSAELAEEWRKALEAEAKHRRMKEVHKLPFVKVRDVLRDRDGEGETWIGLQKALDEISKYMTKTTNLLESDAEGRQVPREVLLELAMVPRWPRMFELLGAAREAPAPKAPSQLDTSCISGSGPSIEPGSWFHSLLLNPPDYLCTGTGEGEFECTILKLWEIAVRVMPEAKPSRARPPSWRDLMYVLDLGDWLLMLRQRVESGRRFRVRQLAQANPTCRIMDGTGRILVNQSPHDGTFPGH